MQEGPVLHQFGLVDLSPRLDQSLLSSWEVATNALDRIKRKDPFGLLIHGMEVGPMMGRTDLHEHPDDDPKEARQLGHVVTLQRP